MTSTGQRGSVVQASYTSVDAPAPNSSNWLTGKSDKLVKNPVTQVAAVWRNKIDYLPDPARNGVEGPGLAGQVFMFGSNLKPASAEGKLIVDLYDETPRQPGQPGLAPEEFEFVKETLKQLRCNDERFGKCYALFLPWPAYRPDVSKVRVTARLVTDGKVIYAPESKFDLNNSQSSTHSQSFQNETQYGSLGAQFAAGSNVNNFGASSLPMGVFGSQAYGASGPKQSSPLVSGPPMPISASPMSNAPLSGLQGYGSLPPATGFTQVPANSIYNP